MNPLSFSKRRTQKVGKGSFVAARRILPSALDTQKRVTLAGRVVKKLSGKTTLEQGLRIKRMIIDYSKKLKEARVSTLSTDIRIIPTKKEGEMKVMMLQNFVPQEDVLSNRLKKCNPKEAVYWFRKTIELIKKVEEYNKNHPAMLGLDAMPKNFGIIEGKLVLIDLYPAYIIGQDQIRTTDISKRKAGFLKLIKRKLVQNKVKRKAANTIQTKMDPKKLTEQVLNQFKKARPELLEQFIDAI